MSTGPMARFAKRDLVITSRPSKAMGNSLGGALHDLTDENHFDLSEFWMVFDIIKRVHNKEKV